jgi:hypothetical protein
MRWSSNIEYKSTPESMRALCCLLNGGGVGGEGRDRICDQRVRAQEIRSLKRGSNKCSEPVRENTGRGPCTANNNCQDYNESPEYIPGCKHSSALDNYELKQDMF